MLSRQDLHKLSTPGLEKDATFSDVVTNLARESILWDTHATVDTRKQVFLSGVESRFYVGRYLGRSVDHRCVCGSGAVNRVRFLKRSKKGWTYLRCRQRSRYTVQVFAPS